MTMESPGTPSSPSIDTTSNDHDSLRDKFENLDSRHVYDKAKAHTLRETARNFVVEFSKTPAEIAFDLSDGEMRELLSHEPPEDRIRWVNVWTPVNQPDIIKAMSDRYSFSGRLREIITAQLDQANQDNPGPRSESAPASPGTAASVTASASAAVPHDATEKTVVEDIESGHVSHDPPPREAAAMSEELMIYKLVKDNMNYTSVDQGDKFFCIGAHWLHRRAGEDRTQARLLQPKHWSWLILCENRTVLSIHDTPIFEKQDPALSEEQKKQLRQKELKHMRSNTTSVLCQISKRVSEDNDFKNNVITRTSVRDLLEPDQSGGVVQATRTEPDTHSDPVFEATSNLFYYLFEDYSGAIPVLQKSRDIVEKLSKRILSSTHRRSKLKPKDIIHDLHRLSKELRQLQHLFESYKSLIGRISRPRTNLGAQVDTLSGSVRLSGKVYISQSARLRFDRLGDRLQLLMLNTIKECLLEQSALSATYFNLTAQKDSQATARLTRSATLLAKLSVFFLPINFMTSYFSVEIPNLVENYTPRTYWISFAVIAGLSFVALFFFSRLLMFFSELIEDWAERTIGMKKRDVEINE